ncbi:MAG TPA: hypothetical protein VGP93_17030, partial [Polyangiaceae bacterium]|nr:hypothetical protein [Polyangiaceae bacterium]
SKVDLASRPAISNREVASTDPDGTHGELLPKVPVGISEVRSVGLQSSVLFDGDDDSHGASATSELHLSAGFGFIHEGGQVSPGASD